MAVVRPDIDLKEYEELLKDNSPIIFYLDKLKDREYNLLLIKVNSYKDICWVRERFFPTKTSSTERILKDAIPWYYLDDHNSYPLYIGIDIVYNFDNELLEGFDCCWEQVSEDISYEEGTLVLTVEEVMNNSLEVILSSIRKEIK